MEQVLSLQQVVDRLTYLEREVKTMRAEVSMLRKRPRAQPSTSEPSAFAYPWADKDEQQRQFDRLFESLAITGTPIGAKRLQGAMAAANLGNDELTQGIIEAREG